MQYVILARSLAPIPRVFAYSSRAGCVNVVNYISRSSLPCKQSPATLICSGPSAPRVNSALSAPRRSGMNKFATVLDANGRDTRINDTCSLIVFWHRSRPLIYIATGPRERIAEPTVSRSDPDFQAVFQLFFSSSRARSARRFSKLLC